MLLVRLARQVLERQVRRALLVRRVRAPRVLALLVRLALQVRARRALRVLVRLALRAQVLRARPVQAAGRHWLRQCRRTTVSWSGLRWPRFRSCVSCRAPSYLEVVQVVRIFDALGAHDREQALRHRSYRDRPLLGLTYSAVGLCAWWSSSPSTRLGDDDEQFGFRFGIGQPFHRRGGTECREMRRRTDRLFDSKLHQA
ncbi:hypothetical protein [Nocardia sp. XZ_19_369]|uniref:hypothetical protein n=1 Tax=Nocardia sp. XZ_19_369 TaxID=2769487 RepID=UPI00188ED90F|nr:hypothetical protein [Nocardia sp. XZ_19_369]